MENNRGSLRSARGTVYLLLVVIIILLITGTAGAQGPDRAGPDSGQTAVDDLGPQLDSVAASYGLSAAELQDLLLNDPTLHVDNSGQLLYIDAPFLGDAAASALESPLAAPFPEADTFTLHSLPGATHKIYLDFNGHTTVGTTWNSGYNVSTIISPPYDIDGNPSTFNATEIERIQRTWQTVAEDFAPFDIDVTTEEPGPGELNYSGGGDIYYGTRVVITDDTFANCGCGGHAYIGSFDDPLDEPVFVYNTSLVGVAEASTHEVGHALSLSHDGTSSASYYTGHGSGATSWAPIMGAGYYVNVTHWSKGDYYDANNGGSSANYGNGPDDLAVIASLTNGNGFGYRLDDHGNNSASATSFTTNGNAISATGIVERTGDVDVFVFNTAAGDVNLSLQPDPERANLDIVAELRDDNWNLIAASNSATILSASISESVAAGTYYVTVDGTGVGSPFSATPTGYTEYGSLGQYSISGTAVDPGAVNLPPSFAVDPIVKGNATVDESFSDTLAGDASDPDGDPLTFSKVAGPAWLNIAADGSISGTPAAGDLGLNSWTVQVDDGNGETDQATLQITVETQPGLFVDFTANSEIFVAGTVTGTYTATQADSGGVQQIEERQSGGKPANRYSYLDHKWLFTVQPGTEMKLYANAWAPTSSDGDAFKLSYSTNDSNYILLGTLSATIDDGYQSFALPIELSGTVYIRLEDTDRASGNRALDTVTVDHLYIRSNTQMPTPPAAPTALAASAQGSSQINLSWTDNSTNELEFRIERSATGTGGWSQVGSAGANSTSYSDTGLTAESSYYYRVYAYNAAGSSATSNVASATTGSAGTMHIASMVDDSTSTSRNRWNAMVTISVVDQGDDPVAGATVSGSWSSGANGGATCVTEATGQCSVTKNNLKSNVASVTFTVEDLQHADNNYDPSANVNGINTVVANQPN